MFPKRAALAALLTVIALVAILSYQTPSPTPLADNGSPVDSPIADASSVALVESPTPTASDEAATPPPTDSPSFEPTDGSTPTPIALATRAPVAPRPVAPTLSRPPTPAPRTPAPGFTGSLTGAAEWIEFGQVQVRAVYSNGRLTDVVALKTPNSDSRSAQIASRAVPILRSEALKAQSAKIHAVSGATYTSQAYAASLQSAIDKKP